MGKNVRLKIYYLKLKNNNNNSNKLLFLIVKDLLQGFARYSVDGKWHVPHFEKMLYDQGQLLRSYAEAYSASKDPFFAEITNDIVTYVIRDLRHHVRNILYFYKIFTYQVLN